jgi:hypothetical protein
VSASLKRATEVEGRPTDKSAGPRHFLDLRDFDPATLRQMLDVAMNYKRAGGVTSRPLAGKTLALIFEKPSTRTRVSFEVGMRQLGGEVIVLSARDMQSGRGESPADTARVLSRYVDAIMMRTDRVSKLHELAQYATVPVINGLTDTYHPCQLMADVLTFEEHRGPIAGQIVAWCGDGNNVARSWIEAAVRFGFTLRLATPEQLRPPQDLLDWARGQGKDRADRRSRKGGCRRALRRYRHLGFHVGRPAGEAPQHARAISRHQRTDGEGGAGRSVHALPAGSPWRGGHRGGDRRPAIGGVRRGGEPVACPKGRARLGVGRSAMSTLRP